MKGIGFTDFFRPTIVEHETGKTDVNNGGGLGTDFVGGSWLWPTASKAERS